MQTNQNQIEEIKELINLQNSPADTVTDEVETEVTNDVETEVTDEVETETEVTTETETEVTDEVETEVTDEVETEVTTEESTGPNTLNELAEAIEVDMEYLYGIKISMPDGEEPITISDLKNERSEQARNTARLEATIAEQQDQLTNTEQNNTAFSNASNERIQLMGSLSNLENQFKNTDWETLEREDPGEAALLQQKFNNAYNATNGQLAQLSEQEQTNKHNSLVKAAERTYELIPEWKDSELRTSETLAIEKALSDEGMTSQQVSGVSDPVAIKLLRELVLLRAEKVEAEKTVEQIRTVPKVLKSKARLAPNPQKAKDKLITKAKNTHNKHDEIAAARAILGL